MERGSGARRSTVGAIVLAGFVLLGGAVMSVGASPLSQDTDQTFVETNQAEPASSPTVPSVFAPASLFTTASAPSPVPSDTPTDTPTAPPTLTPSVTVTPTQTATPAPTQPLTADQRALLDRVIQLTNAERKKKDLPSLKQNEYLMKAAQEYAGVLAPGPCFEHDCPPVPEPWNRALNAGYTNFSRLGENIAAGYESPERVVAGWMDSPGHRANILRPEYKEIGVGMRTGDGEYGNYWVQMFGTPKE